MRKGYAMAKQPINKVKQVESFGERIIILDTETTGLKPENDEVLSLAIVDTSGNTLFDHLIKPGRRKRWPEAQEIHGIKPADVKNEKTLAEYADELAPYFDGSYLIVGYNVKFDIDMLKASGLKMAKCTTFDVMSEYQKESDIKVKLSDCARILGYGQFEAHGALADAKATAYCFSKLLANERYRKICELEGQGMSKETARISAIQQSSSGCILPIVAIATCALTATLAILAVL